MHPNSCLRSKIAFRLTKLSSNRLHKSNLDVVRRRFRELRGKYKNRRVNKVSVKLVECIIRRIGKAWIRWCRSSTWICNREGNFSKVGRCDLRRSGRLIRECSRNAPCIECSRSQHLTTLTTLNKMTIRFSRVGRSRGQMSRGWRLCQLRWDHSTLHILIGIHKQMISLRKVRSRPRIDVWWTKLHSWRPRSWPWATESSNSKSRRRKMKASCNSSRRGWDTSKRKNSPPSASLMPMGINPRPAAAFLYTTAMHRVTRRARTWWTCS